MDRLGQHGFERSERLRGERGDRIRAFQESQAGYLSYIAEDHKGPANGIRSNPCGTGHRLQQDALVHPVSHISQNALRQLPWVPFGKWLPNQKPHGHREVCRRQTAEEATHQAHQFKSALGLR